jgi:hypothetical protein
MRNSQSSKIKKYGHESAFIVKEKFIYTFCLRNKLRAFSFVSFTIRRVSNKDKIIQIRTKLWPSQHYQIALEYGHKQG